MNELDYLLIFVILVGVGIGLRRGFIRVFISIVGIYLTVLVVGYITEPFGDIVAGAFGRIGFNLGTTEARNFIYVVGVIAMTVLVEWVSLATFEETHVRSLRGLDNLLGGIIGVFYGALWASLLLVPVQYSVALTGGAWSTALVESQLVPVLNQIFQNAVVSVVSIFFINGVPQLYRNSIAERVADLLLRLASRSHFLY